MYSTPGHSGWQARTDGVKPAAMAPMAPAHTPRTLRERAASPAPAGVLAGERAPNPPSVHVVRFSTLVIGMGCTGLAIETFPSLKANRDRRSDVG
jgi:hypothetical protein